MMVVIREEGKEGRKENKEERKGKKRILTKTFN